MSKRLFAVAAAVATVLAVAGISAPAGAQTYPPPPASLTVDDPTPAPGQAVTVTMSGCRPGTFALIGVDLVLLGSARAGSDGVAVATVTIPAQLSAGQHTVSGFCIGANRRPLFLRTSITVTPATPPPTAPPTTTPAAPGGTGGTGSAGTGAGSSSSGRGSGTRRVGHTAPPGTVPSPDALAAPTLTPEASTLFENAAEANGVPAGGSRPSSGAEAGEPDARATAATSSTGDVGPLSTAARVGLGLAAVGGVPVALAFSRRPRRVRPRPA